MPRSPLLLVLMLPMSGCYYMQAAAGQWELVRKREPTREVIADSATDPEISRRLQLLDEARDFSITELSLPDNNSYRSYADLERDFVVWNVIAAPEFSLEARKWCFPVAGCVSYRGYFKREGAMRAAARLRDADYDVAVGGVSAYSTLGKFSDPILSTMMSRDDIELVGLLFHELAHQVVYVKGDTQFNESFATAVEEIGLQRWLASRGRADDYKDYVVQREYQRALMRLFELARKDLETLYDSDLPEAEIRDLKRQRLLSLAEHVAAAAAEHGRAASGWLTTDMNNAHLISMSLYEGQVELFRQLYERCERDFSCFYQVVRKRASLDGESRYQLP